MNAHCSADGQSNTIGFACQAILNGLGRGDQLKLDNYLCIMNISYEHVSYG